MMAMAKRWVASLALIECSAFRLSSSCGLSEAREPINALRPEEELSVDFDNV